MRHRLRILGIDPGSRRTGFGIVDVGVNERGPRYVTCGQISTAAGSFPDRLRSIFNGVHSIVDEFSPDVLSIENVFVHRNAQSALKLGQARAAALCASFTAGVEVFEYAPREIKLAIVGTGAASKEQVQHMVQSLLTLDGTPGSDAADALAAALCHAHRRNAEQLIGSVRSTGVG